MNTKNKFLLCTACSSLLSFNAMAELEISGYGSIAAGQVLSGDPQSVGNRESPRFTADFNEVGRYYDQLSFNAESMLALQFRAQLEDNLSMTAQLVAKGSDDYIPDLSWFYLTYEPADTWTVMLGRRNIPMYYFSEYYDVGFAYPWMRPASNVYWWQIVQFNGIHVMKEFSLGDFDSSITAYYGNEYDPDNKEMGMYADARFYDEDRDGDASNGNEVKAVGVDEYWRNIIGVNWNISGDKFDIRLGYIEHILDRDIPNDVGDYNESSEVRTTQTFYTLGGVLDFYPLTLLFEYNYAIRHNAVEDTWPAYLVSAVYDIGDFQPYFSYSKADQYRTIDGEELDDYEEHQLFVYGVRYNFSGSAALKLQYDDFQDDGDTASGWNFHGSSKTVSFGVDFVF